MPRKPKPTHELAFYVGTKVGLLAIIVLAFASQWTL
jgi:hypothetical protein